MGTTNPERVTNAILESVDVRSRTIFLFDEINDQQAFGFIVALRLLDTSAGQITVVLSSGGGFDAAGLAIYDAIRSTRNPVRIEGFGQVQSMAAAIFQAGDERVLAPNTRFMVHLGTGGSWEGAIGAQELQVLAKECQVSCNNYIALLANHSGQPVAQVRKMVEAETYLSAHEAVAAGFADSVLAYPTKHYHRKKKS